jgi:ATP-binding cassette, subfamily D (ALD), peroxisomal long-chain fatty acid import protein
LITISTRASLKKYHTFNLVLGLGENGDEWQFERIGTEREKMQVERELQDLRERLSKVEEWKQRREAIDKELAQVWTEGEGLALDPPPYVQEDTNVTSSSGEMVEKAPTVSTESAELVEKDE